MKRTGLGRQEQEQEGDYPGAQRKTQEGHAQDFKHVADIAEAERANETKFDVLLRNKAEMELRFDRNMDTSERGVPVKDIALLQSNREPGIKIRSKEAVEPRDQWREPSTSKDSSAILGTPTLFDAVYYSVETRDHTVHLELDLVEDFDEELEEFNRLVRIGSFSIAKAFFDLHLKAHISDPYVFVQYAEMLLEKGDFQSLSAMNGSSIFDGHDSLGNSYTTFGSKQRLELNWKLIRALAMCCSQHELQVVWKGLDNLPAQISQYACYDGSTEASSDRIGIVTGSHLLIFANAAENYAFDYAFDPTCRHTINPGRFW